MALAFVPRWRKCVIFSGARKGGVKNRNSRGNPLLDDEATVSPIDGASSLELDASVEFSEKSSEILRGGGLTIVSCFALPDISSWVSFPRSPFACLSIRTCSKEAICAF